MLPHLGVIPCQCGTRQNQQRSAQLSAPLLNHTFPICLDTIGAPVRGKPRTRVMQIFDILVAYAATKPADEWHPIDDIFPAAA